jgi:hypothetical protein
MNRGTHLRVNRGIYHHHGIYIGEGLVIHFYGEYLEKLKAEVKISTFEDFVQNSPIEIVKYQVQKSVDWTIETAYSLIGAKNYHIVSNNCKHFATYCKTGMKTVKTMTEYIPVRSQNLELIPIPIDSTSAKLKHLLNRIRP